MPDTVLDVENVETSYGDFSVSGIDLHLQSGDIFGLMGKSGSGKSTVIETLLGLKQPDTGTITVRIDGEECPINTAVGYSPQENSLYPFLSIAENLETFGRLQDIDSQDIQERREQLLSMLNIREAQDKRVTSLSGGMKKRADLAATLLHDPQIVILDEPFTGIDPPQRDIIWQALQQLARDDKIIIVTSHMLHDLQQHCNKYGLIYHGDFLHTEEIASMMENNNYRNFQTFLRDVFRRK
ncbi:MAG: ABC transporter ATP-binding protein [Candidatus Nanohaloarchaea archaeon]|nr:ABC transporter ATP-binding protein [Candidatus Nanohaloarchaea archaeon]